MSRTNQQYKVTHYGFEKTSRTISAPSPRQAVTKTYGRMGGGITVKTSGLTTDFVLNDVLRFRVQIVGGRK